MVFGGRRLGMWLKTTSLNKTAKNRRLYCLSSLFPITQYLNKFPTSNDHGWLVKL